MKQRNKAIPAAYILLERDNKYLIAKRYNTGYEDGKYQVPAGHIEESELPSDGIVREAKEEIGIDIEKKDLELVHISYRPKHDNTDNRVDFFFRAKRWKGEPKIMEPNKCDELKWISLDKIPNNMTLHIRIAFNSLRDGTFYREISLEELRAAGLSLL